MIRFLYSTMFAGKTTDCLKAYDIYRRKGLNPIILKPVVDDREGSFKGWGWTQSRITRDRQPAYYYTDLQKELPQLDYGCIMVDEAQFLSRDDVLYLADVVDSKNIPMLAYGLKTDVNGNLFEGAAALLAVADECQELTTLCQMPNCMNPSQVHLRYIDGQVDTSKEAGAIEKGNVTYRAVCRKCWREATK